MELDPKYCDVIVRRWQDYTGQQAVLEGSGKSFSEVVKHYDCSILCGHRNSAGQTQVYNDGLSKLRWARSKHNSYPSKAVDVVPYPVDWKDTKRFYHFIGFVLGTAQQMGIKVRSGSDWDQDNDFSDQKFINLPHFELAD